VIDDCKDLLKGSFHCMLSRLAQIMVEMSAFVIKYEFGLEKKRSIHFSRVIVINFELHSQICYRPHLHK